jgi:hypothetical protein
MDYFRGISLPLISLGFLSLLAPATQAAVIDKGLTIQVYRLCDDSGNNCASKGPVGDEYFSAAVNKIWAQAGISVGFNFVGDIWSTAYSFLNDSVAGDGFADLAGAHGSPGVYSTTAVDMFLVHTVAGVYGEGWLGYGGLVMAMDSVMAYNGGNGRIDTIAHELGHNFGLLPDSLGGVGYHSTAANELMASGGIRLIPTSVANIAPDGLGYDYLTPAQITLARSSSLLHDISSAPEPASAALIGLGLVTIGLIRRRKP